MKNEKSILHSNISSELSAYKRIIANYVKVVNLDEKGYMHYNVYAEFFCRELYKIMHDPKLIINGTIEKKENIPVVDYLISKFNQYGVKLSDYQAKCILKAAKNVIKYLEITNNGTSVDESQRNTYLKGIADGTIVGPISGKPSFDKLWYQHYDIDDINAPVPKTSIYNYMKSRCTDYNLVAINYFNNKITFSEMLKKTNELANSFYKLGVRKGDCVSVLLPNTPESVYTLYALNKIGAIANIVDFRKKNDMLVHSINETNSKIIIASDLFLSNIDEVKDRLCTDNIYVSSIFDSAPKSIKMLCKNTGFGLPKDINFNKQRAIARNYKTFDDLMDVAKGEEFNIKSDVKSDDVVSIVHTSGTTGASKAVQLTNYNYNAMVMEYEDVIVKAEPGERILTQVPPFLAYTTIMATHLPLCLNVTLVMLPDYEFDKTADNVYKYKINHIVGAPGDYYSFLNNPKTAKRDYSFVKTLGSGSDSIETEIRKAVNLLLAQSNCESQIFEGYGMTEVGSAAVTNLPYYIVDGSVGIPLPKMSVKIINPDTLQECTYDEEGEICFSGATLTKGYYNNSEANNQIMLTDRSGQKWIRSGDKGFINKKGNLFYRGRIKRTIVLYEGIKVNPMDIEEILNKDDRVKSSCVVGIPNLERDRGDIPVANIVLNSKYLPDLDSVRYEYCEQIKEDLLKECERQLGPNYVPKKIIVRDSLLLTPVGKVDYRAISYVCNDEINNGYTRRGR